MSSALVADRCRAVAARSPDSRLMSVVLPAPFGPSTACSLPRSSSIATSLTAGEPAEAARQPPRGEHRRQSSCGLADQRAPEPARDAREPARQEDHQQDDRRRPAAAASASSAPGRSPCSATNANAPTTAPYRLPDAAQDQHQQHVARLVPRQELGIDEAELQRRQVAGEPGERAGEREARELVAVRPGSRASASGARCCGCPAARGRTASAAATRRNTNTATQQRRARSSRRASRCARSNGVKPPIAATGLKFMLMPSEPRPNFVSWNTK